MKLELSLSDCRVDLVEEGYDLALRITQELETTLVARPLAMGYFSPKVRTLVEHLPWRDSVRACSLVPIGLAGDPTAVDCLARAAQKASAQGGGVPMQRGVISGPQPASPYHSD